MHEISLEDLKIAFTSSKKHVPNKKVKTGKYKSIIVLNKKVESESNKKYCKVTWEIPDYLFL